MGTTLCLRMMDCASSEVLGSMLLEWAAVKPRGNTALSNKAMQN